METIDEKLKILRPVLGVRRIQRLRQMYFIEDDFREKKEIENHIDLLISRFVKKNVDDEIILPPPSRDLCAGELKIGDIEYLGRLLYPFNLRLNDINRHAGIFGATGSGKTTFAKNIIRNLHERGIPFLIFDWEKSYRNLINEMPDVQVFTVGNDINPLFLNFLTVPPGIDYGEYIKSIIAIISEDYVGGIGADTMLLNYMEIAYEETGHPFFEDLKQVVLKEINRDMGRNGRLSGRSGLWKESVSRQITFLSKGAAGTIVNERKHFPLEELFSRPIVLEFGNLKSPYDRKFFIHVILNWLSIYNQHRGIYTEKLKQVLIFEEFHNIVMQGKKDDMVSSLFRESRKYGIGLIAIDQTPSEIPNSIFANMNVKISFSLGTSRDISAMAKAMNLDSHRASYLGMLKTGQAVSNIKQRHHESFLIRPPFVQRDENIRDEELRRAMSKFSGQIRTCAPGIEDRSISQTSQKPDNPSPLKPLEKVLFSNIVERSLDAVDVRTKRLGFHPSQMSQIHEELTRKGLVRPVYIDRKKLFEVTDHGKKIAEDLKIFMPPKRTRGGLEHDYWVQQIIKFLQKNGFDPACEMDNIDLVDKESDIAIEIETGKSDINANVNKLNNYPIKNCFMVATSKQLEMKLRGIQKNHPAIRVFFVRDFLNLSKDQLVPSPLKNHTGIQNQS